MALEKQRPGRGLTVWQPFGELEEMGRRFEDFFGRPVLPSRRFPAEESGWVPAIVIVEEEDKFVVKVELPGVKEEDVSISVAGDMLTIEGEKKAHSEAKKKGYYYSESSYGSFSRSINMPSTVHSEKIEANFDKGVLEITLPKTPEVKVKKIALAPKKKGLPRGRRKKELVADKKKEEEAATKEEAINKKEEQ